MQVLRQLPILNSRNLLVGTATGDDAGVYRIDRNRALVQTTDFFTPIVDDPFAYGQIAATNALSDVYAMGGRPLTALNILGIPADSVPPHIINLILRGGAAKIKEAKCVLIGGHTIRNPEPIYGLAVTGTGVAAAHADQREGSCWRRAGPDETARHRYHHHRD